MKISTALLTLLSTASLLASGCSDEPAQRESPRDTTSIRDTVPAAGKAAETTAHSFRKLPFDTTALPPFDRTQLPKEFHKPAAIAGGARWIDVNGENTLVILERLSASGEYERYQEVLAYAYLSQGDSTRLLWKIMEGAPNECDLGHGVVCDVEVSDIDGDGIAESAFIYNVQGACDVSPIPYKLIMHSGGTKYAIRGTSRVKPGEDAEWMGGEKKFDPAFDSAPEKLKAFASAMWDRCVGKYTIAP